MATCTHIVLESELSFMHHMLLYLTKLGVYRICKMLHIFFEYLYVLFPHPSSVSTVS